MKKKVAIATWVGNISLNYGSVLQSTAMQKLIRDCDCIPLTINHKFTTPTSKKEFQKSWKNRVKKLGSSYFLHWLNFSYFIKKNMNLSPVCFSENDIIHLCKDKCDVLLCGSDAIWKDCWIRPLFLWDYDEIRDIPAIAYAASVQKGDIAYGNMAQALEHFVGISGREKKVEELLQHYTNKNVETVLDPTLSVDEEFWIRLSGKRLMAEEYILCYFISEAELHHLSVEKIKKKYGVETIVYINTDIIDKTERIYTDYQGMDYKQIVGPAEFLSLFQYATAVCTDSLFTECASLLYFGKISLFSQEKCYGK